MFRDINNGNMAYYRTKIWFNLARFSLEEISSNLRKSYLSFKEICETGSESPEYGTNMRLLSQRYRIHSIISARRTIPDSHNKCEPGLTFRIVAIETLCAKRNLNMGINIRIQA